VENYKHSLPEFTEVIIIGGGLAGAATALTLAARGIPCLVVEYASGVKAKIGEVLSPNMTPLLHQMGLDNLINQSIHLPAYGNRFIWGSNQPFDKLFITQTNRQGWHLDRRDFEQKLSQFARKRGAKWFENCKFLDAHDHKGEWQVSLHYQGQKQSINAQFLVDATGRGGRLTRRLGIPRNFSDRLLGLACYFSLAKTEHIPHFTHIETVPNGWWYAALLTDKRLVTVFMTDADLCHPSMQKIEGYWQKIQQTQLIKTLFPGDCLPPVDGGIRVKPAQTSCLISPVGDNWLAVGDAAFAYDPISSYGIGSALGGGYYAGNAIADYLNKRPEALPAYQMVTERAFAHYLSMLRYQYLQEQRWHNSPFWSRRHQEDFPCQWL